MSASSNPAGKRQSKAVLVIVLIASFIFVVLPISIVLILKPGEVLTTTLEFVTYSIIFLVTFWGLRKDKIALEVNGQNILGALAFLGIGWFFYVCVLHISGMAKLPDELKYLSGIPAWQIGLLILRLWFFVGLAEELLFRGYFLGSIPRFLTGINTTWRTGVAVIITSIIFSLWHLPQRIYQVISGQMSLELFALSFGIIFCLGVGFAYLFIRSRNIILVGLVHGVMDFPLIGLKTQLNFIILVAVIVCVEIYRWVGPKRLKETRPMENESL
jgi:membrane protease YdiL (CAAX protease family)